MYLLKKIFSVYLFYHKPIPFSIHYIRLSYIQFLYFCIKKSFSLPKETLLDKKHSIVLFVFYKFSKDFKGKNLVNSDPVSHIKIVYQITKYNVSTIPDFKGIMIYMTILKG